MGLNGALNVGRSALAASQAAIQVAGNNLANAATPGFNRRSIHLASLGDEIVGRNSRVGTGVEIQTIRREVDVALQSRLRDAISQQHESLVDQRFLNALETVQNELTENDLSSLFSEFFNAFSEVANNPEEPAIRAVAIQEGVNLASRLADTRREYDVVREQVDEALGAASSAVNDLLDRLARVNGEIAQTEAGQTEAASLRDQRDQLVNELAEYIDITAIEQSNGQIDILVGSTPVLLGSVNRGLEVRFATDDDIIEVEVRVQADGTLLDVQSGEIGSLIHQREETIEPAINAINTLAESLIFEVNRLHSQGQGQSGFAEVAGTYNVDDVTAALNSDDANLPFDVGNGSFFLHVTHSQSGERVSHRIDINGNTDSLQDIVDAINIGVGVPNATGSITAGRELSIVADAGYELSFSDDTSGALAALGINSFFVGEDSTDINVHDDLLSDPGRLAVGRDHVAGSNDTALAIAGLQDVPVAKLNNQSLRDYWQQQVNEVAVKSASANDAVAASQVVRDSLDAQVQAVSGVSIDEETINLLQYQRQFQAAARFISVIDESLQVLLSIA